VLAYLVSVWKCRNFWLSLVISDLQLRYRRSVLGIGWSMLSPVATAMVMGVVFHEIFHQPIREFLPYLLCGLACWSYITGSTVGGCQSYIQAEPYIRQHPLPLAIYPLRNTLGIMIHFLIALVLVVVLKFALLRGASVVPHGPALVLGLLILLCFSWAASAITGFINVAFRDTQHLMEIGFQILFYLTPVAYPKEVILNSRLGWFLGLNPLMPLIDVVRIPILHGHPASSDCYTAALAFTGATALVAVLTLGWQQRRVVHYL
jgi:lipopolysaccharide transport system permease protein